MAGSKFRSQVEVLSVVNKGRRRDWTNAEKVRIVKESLTRLLTDGCVCLMNNAAERSLRGTALGRKAWLFAGSDRGGDRTAFMYSLIITAKMNDIDPQAWLADVLARMPALTVSRLPELLPWNWHDPSPKQKAA